MAKTATKERAKPAASKPATKKQPATKQPAVQGGVTLRDLANDLGRDPKSVRASIRRFKGGAQVGQGGRYVWKSKKDPAYVELLKAFSKSEKAEAKAE